MLGKSTFLLAISVIMGLTSGVEVDETVEILGNFSSANRDTHVAQGDFALSLLRFSCNDDENAIISPISVSLALSMAAAGAKGNTARQIRDVIAKGSTDEELHDYFHGLIANETDDEALYQLNLVNRLYVQDGLDVLDTYRELISSHYNGELEMANFTDSANVAQGINDFVEKRTNSKIKDLVTADMFDEFTRMVIINAVYFKGLWRNEFRAKDTSKEVFYSSEDSNQEVDMMHAHKYYDYAETDDFQMLSMNYKGATELSMLIFLPKEKFGLAKLERDLTAAKIFEMLRNSTREDVMVTLPRFKIEKGVKMVQILKTMGIEIAFSEKADFSGISASPLVISDVVHKAFISVDEKGTEAAAATGVVISLLSAMVNAEPPKIFTADHPFLFAIVYGDSIVFIGRLCNIE